MIRLLGSQLSTTPAGDTVLLGSIDNDSLAKLLVDPTYQREELHPGKIREIKQVLRARTVPVITLNQRGSDDFDVEPGGTTIVLAGDVYIVDGQQRTCAALELLGEQPIEAPLIRAMVHLGKDQAWEREEFGLQLRQTRISPNVQIRNLGQDNKAIGAIIRLTQEDGCPVRDRVQWQQTRNSAHLITGKSLVKAAGALHGHMGYGTRVNRIDDLALGLDKLVSDIGQQRLKANMREFLRVLDKVWGLQGVAYPRAAVHLKTSFLFGLANFFSHYENFWDGATFRVDSATIKKLQSFPLNDPSVVNFAGLTGSRAELMVEDFIVNHVNRNRTTNRLIRRFDSDSADSAESFEDEDE